MGWSIGYDLNWDRDIGYGVPSICDHPGCGAKIDRGLAYVCGNAPYGGDHGCGLFFCSEHRGYACEEEPCSHEGFQPTSDTDEWVRWKLTDESWQRWRDENPEEVQALRASQAPPRQAPTSQVKDR